LTGRILNVGTRFVGDLKGRLSGDLIPALG